MAAASYQTVKLSRGKHESAEQGACVMELASMIAEEPFTDRPVSVCPVIGSFLRTYNDSIDDGRRQALYAYAAKVVGSRRPLAVQRARADHLAAWALQMRVRRWSRACLPARFRALGIEKRPSIDLVGPHAVRSISRVTDAKHSAVLAVVDELLALGTVEEVATPAVRTPRRTVLLESGT